MASELSELFENFKKEMGKEMRDAIREEISNLNIAVVLEEHTNKYEQLRVENGNLKVIVRKQQKLLEMTRRSNNVIFYGIQDMEGENFDRLEETILDLCNKILTVPLTRDHLNYVKRIGKIGVKNRPVVVSLVSNIQKRMILQNGVKLKGSRIYLAEDNDKESQLKRKELFQMRNHSGSRPRTVR